MTGLYFHIPFCRRKCPYCDFFSVAAAPDLLDAYPALLLRQLELSRSAWPGPVATVFFGGGTPSLLPPRQVGALLTAVDRTFGLASGAEISLEANPGTLDRANLAGFRAAGVNRLSLGIQSLDDLQLERLGRIHRAAEAVAAFRLSRRCGIANISCDLMFGLPHQGLADLRHELTRMVELGPDHLSCYGLAVEEQTPFHHLHRSGGLELPDDERYADLYLELHRILTANGFGHYEISNYALPGRECRHNLAYWQRRPYLGVGAGAHSFRDRDWGERLAVPGDLDDFRRRLLVGSDPAQVLETFDRRGAMAETLYLGLRTAAGVGEESFRRRFGQGVGEAFPAAVAQAGSRLRLNQGAWHFPPEEWLLFDHLIAPFLG